MNTDCERAYLGGYFDGEGCIAVLSCGARQYRYPELRVTLVTSDDIVLRAFSQQFGGRVYVVEHVKRKRKKLFRWCLRMQDASDFLSQIRPYLRAKLVQVDFALGVEWAPIRFAS